jgi:hypothetical protein
MITPEERMIFDMLSAKIGQLPVIELENKRKTKKEIEQEVIQNAIKHRTSRAIKKNLQKKFKESSKKVL